MRIDIMTDIETLGVGSNATIFQIAAIAFDITTGEIYDKTFNMTADIEKSNNLVVSGSTIKWWLNTNKELMDSLLNSGTCSCEYLLIEFHNWLTNFSEEDDVYLWGNGILFDNNLIKTQMEKLGLKYPIFYRNDRDMRTLDELASHKMGFKTNKEFKDMFWDTSLVAHDAFDDVKQQINIVINAYRILMEK